MLLCSLPIIQTFSTNYNIWVWAFKPWWCEIFSFESWEDEAWWQWIWWPCY